MWNSILRFFKWSGSTESESSTKPSSKVAKPPLSDYDRIWLDYTEEWFTRFQATGNSKGSVHYRDWSYCFYFRHLFDKHILIACDISLDVYRVAEHCFNWEVGDVYEETLVQVVGNNFSDFKDYIFKVRDYMDVKVDVLQSHGTPGVYISSFKQLFRVGAGDIPESLL